MRRIASWAITLGLAVMFATHATSAPKQRAKTAVKPAIKAPASVTIDASHKSILGLAYTPSGEYLTHVGADNYVTFRLANKEYKRAVAVEHDKATDVYFVPAIAWAPDGKYLATGGEEGAILWKLTATNEKEMLLEVPFELHLRTTAVAFSPDSTRLLTSHNKGGIACWNVETGEKRWDAEGGSDMVDSLAFSPDGKLIANTAGRRTLLRNAETGGEVREVGKQATSGCCLAFTPDGKRLLVGDSAGGVTVWTLGEKPKARVLRSRSASGRDTIIDLAIGSNGQEVVTVDHAGEAVVWNLASGKGRRLMKAETALQAVAIRNDGTVAIGDEQGRLTIFPKYFQVPDRPKADPRQANG